MPPDPTHTIEEILRSAKEEFLKEGFAGASLRKIAAGAGVTTGALYRHFAGKEALFERLVEPICSTMLSQMEEQTTLYDRLLDTEGMGVMWEESVSSYDTFIDYIYEHFDIFKLLLSASEQTVYENFMERLIQKDVDLTKGYLDHARKNGVSLRVISEEELHILISAQCCALFEIVLHDIPKERGRRYAQTAALFTSGGWQRVLES